jgi:dienelactone hydrolase
MQRRTFSLGLVAGALTSARLGALAHEAPPPYAVVDFDWIDPARARAVPARLHWPTGATAERPVPLVVFSHGIGGSRLGYSYLGRHWASRGVASLHVQHVGSDAALWRGNPFGLVGRLQAAAQEREAIARALDVRFALDRVLDPASGPMALAVDRQRLVAAGHSYGANTTLLTVGAQVRRDGRALGFLDDRFGAAVIISAPPFYGETDLHQVLQGIAVPTMHVTATEDVIEIPGYRSGVADRLAIFEATADPRKLLAVFRGGSHSMFTDRAYTGGAALNPQVKRATADLALAFIDWALHGDARPLGAWQEAWQALLSRSPTVPAASLEAA